MSERRALVQELKALFLSERLACGLVGLSRSSFRYQPQLPATDEEELRAEIVRLAQCHRRYGYRRITALLRRQGPLLNAKRVWRIWKSAGLSLPRKRPRRRRQGGASTKLHRGSVLGGRSTNPGGMFMFSKVTFNVKRIVLAGFVGLLLVGQRPDHDHSQPTALIQR